MPTPDPIDIDPFPGPNGPFPVPPDIAFSALDATLPLALLPLRLEVRFWFDSVPPELRVRIFPDLVHADGHQPGLTKAEQQLGQAFWRRCWRAGPDPLLVAIPDPDDDSPAPGSAGRDAAFAWLAGRLGPWRAAWVANQTEPLNNDLAPRTPVPDHTPLLPPPAFPDLRERTAGGPTYARLLPARFALVAWDNEGIVGSWWGEPIDPDVPLPLAPGLVETTDDLDGRALLDAQGLSWTYDFDEAERIGMAIRVNLSMLDERYTVNGFARLMVLGAGIGDQQEGLEALLAAHRYTHGLDFIPQGTPTNATETGAPSLCLERPDPAAIRFAEVGPAAPQPDGDAPRPAAAGASKPAVGDGSKPGTAPVVDEGDLYRMTAAEAATAALGLSAGTAFARASNRHLAELRHGEAIARTLWPGMLGNYLDALMQVGLNPANRTWLRDWSTRFVRGGALLPTLLVGAQPYGLLPVSLIGNPREPVGRVQHLEQVLGQLRVQWDDSLWQVPRLDPEAGDAAPGAGERAALVSQILGATAHPVAFALQTVIDNRDDYVDAWDGRLFATLAFAAFAPEGDVPFEPDGPLPSDWQDESQDDDIHSPLWRHWIALRDGLEEATTPEDQIEWLETFLIAFPDEDSTTYTQEELDAYAFWADLTRSWLIDFVAAHETRTEWAKWLTRLVPDITRLMGDADDPSAFFTEHPPTRADWALPLVADGRDEADVEELRDWLDGVAVEVAAGRTPDHDFTAAQPLLRQLVAWSAQRAALSGDGHLMADGLNTLVALCGTATDPVGELERLVREGISTSAYRLDAWYTGIAAARLEGKRSRVATGIQVGAYGWLEDVKPRGRRASQGYVLAPSPAHATAASILRSGWSAFGGDAESAGLAVDLSSDRIRRARWLIGGVRDGQDLGRLLGARFERAMHDAGADALIEDVRERALAAAGDPSPPTAIVDGLLLARGRAYQEAPVSERDDYTDAEGDVAGELDELLADTSIPSGQRTGLAGSLDALLDDLDSVADASVAQSVFSLVEGNVPEATATLSASATGEATFPRLRFADSRRTATTITHRLVLLVKAEQAGSWPAAATSGRALAAPPLEAWIEGVLGDPARYALNVRFVDPATGKPAAPPVASTLAAARLSALDVVRLAPAGEQTGLGSLGAVLAAWAEGLRPPELDPAAVVELDTGAGDPSLDDLAVTARALRALLEESRDLDGRDLVPPGATDAVSGLDTAELEARSDDVLGALQSGRRTLVAALAAPAPGDGRPPRATPSGDGVAPATASSAALRAAMLALGGFELAGAVPRGADLVAQARALLAAVDRRLAEYAARVAEEADGWEALDELGRYRALRDRLALLVGHRLPLTPRFKHADGAGLDASFARPRLRSPTAATEWLAAAGRVDPGARRLRVAADLAEALDSASRFEFAVGQLPDHPDEGWAAVSRPSRDDRGRLCLLATGAAPKFGGGPVAGLVLGTWTEALPRHKRTAALGVHFDSPAARAPQAILLCSAEEETGFSFELVRDQLAQTLDLAKVRLLAPHQITALGQCLPAAYLQGAIPAGATT